MLTAPVGSLDRLLETLDLRRPAVAAHSRRVAAYARLLGIGMGLDRRRTDDPRAGGAGPRCRRAGRPAGRGEPRI